MKGGEHIQLYCTIRNVSHQSLNQYTLHHSKPVASQDMAQQCKIHNAANW